MGGSEGGGLDALMAVAQVAEWADLTRSRRGGRLVPASFLTMLEPSPDTHLQACCRSPRPRRRLRS